MIRKLLPAIAALAASVACADLPAEPPAPSTNAPQPRCVVAVPEYHLTNSFVGVKGKITETLLEAGFIPVVLPEMDDAAIDQVLAHCDGMLIGGDVADQDSKLRNSFERRVMSLAEKRGLPIVGICHGGQLINKHYGGTLTTVPDARRHVHKKTKRTGPMAEHFATVLPGDSLMSRVFGEGRLKVNSSHIWRCGDLAPGFRVTCVSEEDEIIEAIEHERLPIFGFQFHPEYYWGKDPRFLELIRNAFSRRHPARGCAALHSGQPNQDKD